VASEKSSGVNKRYQAVCKSVVKKSAPAMTAIEKFSRVPIYDNDIYQDVKVGK